MLGILTINQNCITIRFNKHMGLKESQKTCLLIKKLFKLPFLDLQKCLQINKDETLFKHILKIISLFKLVFQKINRS